MTKQDLIRRIAEMEKRIKDRTYYGKLSEYNCDLYYQKQKLDKLLTDEKKDDTMFMERLSVL